MSNITGITMKFIVIKNEDIERALSEHGQESLQEALNVITAYRKQFLDKETNTYLVINANEPYADEVIDILKRHGHWG